MNLKFKNGFKKPPAGIANLNMYPLTIKKIKRLNYEIYLLRNGSRASWISLGTIHK